MSLMQYNKNPISLREGKVFIDGIEVLDSIKCEIKFTPDVWEGRQLGERTPSSRWLGCKITGTVTRRRSTPCLDKCLSTLEAETRRRVFMEVQVQEGRAMMYETVNDVLREKGIDPKDAFLIRHTDSSKDKEHRFRRALEAGYIKEYTAMQEPGFAKEKEYLVVFLGERPTAARFFALYRIQNRFQTRIGHVPDDYPVKSEVEEIGDYLELKEESLPPGLKGFVIEWGESTSAWKQHPAIHDKAITDITTE